MYPLKLNELALDFSGGEQPITGQARNFFKASKTVLRRHANDPAMFTDL
jgi:hypothetical protein